MIRFKVDENLPAEAALILRAAGHDALTVRDQNLQGSSDERIAAVCQAEARALVTLDLDFADILRFPPTKQAGIIVLRLSRTDKPTVLASVSALAPLLDTLPLEKRLWIVEEGRIRIRG